MIGITSYRDYLASAPQGRSSKYESLCQYTYDLKEVIGDSIEIVPTTEIGQDGTYDAYSNLLIFEHPTSLMQKSAGGFTTPNVVLHFRQLEKLFAYERDVLSCNLELINLKRWVRNMNCRRKNPKTSFYKIPTDEEFFAFFDRALSHSYTKDLQKLRGSRSDFAIGDSHTPMFWKPGRTVEAMYGRTLYRTLNEGLSTIVPPTAKEVTFCFGNIDLRHHFNRCEDPFETVEEMAKEYARQADELECEATICELLPVISVDRTVTKSYWYKDEPHSGSEEVRTALCQRFNKVVHECARHTRVISPPSFFTDSNGLLNSEVIERTKGGIHVSPKYYAISTRSTKPENSWQ